MPPPRRCIRVDNIDHLRQRARHLVMVKRQHVTFAIAIAGGRGGDNAVTVERTAEALPQSCAPSPGPDKRFRYSRFAAITGGIAVDVAAPGQWVMPPFAGDRVGAAMNWPSTTRPPPVPVPMMTPNTTACRARRRRALPTGRNSWRRFRSPPRAAAAPRDPRRRADRSCTVYSELRSRPLPGDIARAYRCRSAMSAPTSVSANQAGDHFAGFRRSSRAGVSTRLR